MRIRLLAAAATLVAVTSVAATAGAVLGERFSDVPADHRFAAEIEAVADACIVTGYADGTFRPTGGVSRQTLAAMLARGLPALLHDAGNDVTVTVEGEPECRRHVALEGQLNVSLAGADLACGELADPFLLSALTMDGTFVNDAPLQGGQSYRAWVTVGPGTHTFHLTTAASGDCTGSMRVWGELAAEVYAVGSTDAVEYPPFP